MNTAVNDLFTQSDRIRKLQATVMVKHTLRELAVIENRDRHHNDTFESFCAAKFEINDRGFQCAACSLLWHKYGGESRWCSPCDSCKKKPPIPQVDLRVR